MRAVWGIIAVEQQSPQERTNAENREVVRRHDLAVYALCIGTRCEAQWLWLEPVGIHVDQRLLTFQVIAIVRVRQVVESASILGPTDVNQPRRVFESWQWSQQQRARDGKNRRVRADSYGKRECRCQSEQRTASE